MTTFEQINGFICFLICYKGRKKLNSLHTLAEKQTKIYFQCFNEKYEYKQIFLDFGFFIVLFFNCIIERKSNKQYKKELENEKYVI